MKVKGINTKFFVSAWVLFLLVFSFFMVSSAYSSSWAVKISYSTSEYEEKAGFFNGIIIIN